MEPEPTMEARPPAFVDAIVRALIPPACREAVMGDLWERYTSPAGYLGDALRALPFLIVSRIRRTTNAPMVALAFLMLFASFGGGPWLWLRAVIPALAVLATFLLRDAYQGLSVSPTRRAIGDGVAVAASALATQAVLAIVRPELLLTRWGMLTGSLTCLALIAGRLAGPGANLHPSLAGGTALSLDELRGEMRQVERAARVTRHVETGAGILVIAFGVAGTAWAPQITAKAGFALMAAGAAFVVLYMRRHALRPLPMDLGFDASRVAFRDALVQGERLLRRVWLWYLLPLIVGPLVLIVGWSVAQRRSFASALGFLGIMAIMTVLAWRMNRDAANRLARRIEALDQTDERA